MTWCSAHCAPSQSRHPAAYCWDPIRGKRWMSESWVLLAAVLSGVVLLEPVVMPEPVVMLRDVLLVSTVLRARGCQGRVRCTPSCSASDG